MKTNKKTQGRARPERWPARPERAAKCKLSKAQIAHIQQAAIEETMNDLEGNRHFALALVTRYVEGLSLAGQLGLISGERECQAEILGFDPVSGKKIPD